MERVYNFSAGPSAMPVEVLEEAKKELVCYGNSGMSVMEMSHRSSDFDNIINEAKQDLIDLLNIPDNYEVLFLQGGGSMQFAMIPINLGVKNKKAQYLDTGAWSAKAIKEAKRSMEIDVVASSKETTYNYVPKIKDSEVLTDIDYFYLTTNNTIYGTQVNYLPDTKGVPIITDMSSCILSRPVDVSKYGLIFAGAQKNIGPAGVTVVIVRKDLIGQAPEGTYTMLDYKTHAEKNSMFNTPPTYGIYMAGKVFKWLKAKGGLAEVEKMNNKKANLLYDYIDATDFYEGTAAKEDRSIMNVPFICANDDLNKAFIEGATKIGLVNLKGHRSVGGMRASIYNSMPYEGVEKLVEYMKEFAANN